MSNIVQQRASCWGTHFFTDDHGFKEIIHDMTTLSPVGRPVAREESSKAGDDNDVADVQSSAPSSIPSEVPSHVAARGSG